MTSIVLDSVPKSRVGDTIVCEMKTKRKKNRALVYRCFGLEISLRRAIQRDRAFRSFNFASRFLEGWTDFWRVFR